MTKNCPRFAGSALILLILFGLGACSSPAGDPVSPCADYATTQCLISHDDWTWTSGVARSVQF